MLLKEKNKLLRIFAIPALGLYLLVACTNQTQSETEKQRLDSLSRVQQRRHADSLKKQNPLLILPPDSTYTGEYIDKYPNGIIKFKGQFRFGERHGHWMSFFPNGDMWSEMHYDKGLREGPNKVMRENGHVFYAGFFKADKQDSIWDYYDEQGKIVKKVIYKQDRVVKEINLP